MGFRNHFSISSQKIKKYILRRIKCQIQVTLSLQKVMNG